MPGQTRPRTFLAARRLELDKPLREYAEATGYAISFIAYIEKGGRCGSPTARRVIAKLDGMKVSDLFDERGYPRPLPGEGPLTPLPATRLPAGQVRRIVNLHKKGWTDQAIAADVGVKKYAVVRTLAQEGLRRSFRGVPLETYLKGAQGVSDDGRVARPPR